MKPVFMASQAAFDKKPPHGQPCTRCGLCCVATICPLGQHVFGRKIGPCPALSYDDQGSICGLIADPMKWFPIRAIALGVDHLKKAARHLIGSSTGCDARFNGEKPDQAFYARLIEHDRQTISLTRWSKRVWGIK